MFKKATPLAALMLAAISLFVSGAPARAAATASISGTVVNESSGAPVSGAKVTLLVNGGTQSATTDKDGKFAFTGLTPGTYELRASGLQFVAYDTSPFSLADGQQFQLAVFLQPAGGNAIASIGRVVALGHTTLNHSSSAVDTIVASTLQAQGITQIQNGLQQLPGITIQHFNNGAPGNVATLTIRGAGGFAGGANTGYEVLVLQDGEPLRNGQYGDFDLSTLTPAIYQRVEVVKGVGGTSLFGANTIGGTVNLVTRDPQATEGGELIYAVSGFGTQDVNLSETNTVGRVGYLLDLHQFGTNGYIPPNYVVDYGFGEISNPTLYFGLKSLLGKVKYQFSPSTYGVISATDESDIRDQSGLQSQPNGYIAASGFPSFFGFPGNYVTNIQPKYAFDLHTALAGGSLELRTYHQLLYRIVDGENGATPAGGCCYIETESDRLTGDLAIWNKEIGNSTLTIAAGGNGDYFNYGSLSGSSFTPSTHILFTPTACLNFGNCQATQIERTILVRDDDAIGSKFDLTAAGYYSDYNTLNVKRFDPRVGVVNKPDSDTVVRASVGTGFAAPRLSDLQAYLNTSHFSASPYSGCPNTEPACAASAGNPNVSSETALGFDLGYEKLFGSDGHFNIDLYRSLLHNHIFYGFEPAPPGTPTFDNGMPILFLEKPINIAGTTYTGIETDATIPLGDRFDFNPYYNIQSAYPTDVPLSTQQTLGNVVDNQQYQGVPLHKYGWSVDFHTLPHTTTASIGADYFAKNNNFDTVPFWSYNASLSTPIGDSELHIGWTNIFNTQAGLWSVYQSGVPYPGASGCAAFGPCATGDLYKTTLFQQAPHMLTVTFDHRWGSLH
jgi:outer membrane receptor protein involved in Fe transport